jgi:hypothetical protein
LRIINYAIIQFITFLAFSTNFLFTLIIKYLVIISCTWAITISFFNIYIITFIFTRYFPFTCITFTLRIFSTSCSITNITFLAFSTNFFCLLIFKYFTIISCT